MPRIVQCKGCNGVQESDAEGRPYGWYSLTVKVPPRLGKHGKPFVWVGLWCSIVCLAGDLPLLADQEELARMAYEAGAAVPAGSLAAARLQERALRAVR